MAEAVDKVKGSGKIDSPEPFMAIPNTARQSRSPAQNQAPVGAHCTRPNGPRAYATVCARLAKLNTVGCSNLWKSA